MLGQDMFVKSQLCLIAWREAHHYGGHLGMVMVAQAISNRKKNGWGSWTGVFEGISMYSAKNVDEQPTGYPDLMEPNFIKLLQEVDGIYDGTGKDMVKGAVYWCDLADISREWFKDKIVRSPEHPKTTDMNTLVFYK